MLPEYDYVYLGDNARAPYGGHSEETIYNYTLQAVEFLFDQGCELVILACNTATAAALRRLQKEYLPSSKYSDRRVLGVIRPVVEAAVRLSVAGKLGVMGTRLTIESEAFLRELEAQIELQGTSRVKIYQQACPLLVPLIEEGWERKPETRKILRTYLKPLKTARVDVLLLGCTHYPILMKEIKGIMGPRVRVLNPGEVVAQSLKDYLTRHPEMSSRLSKKGSVRFLTTEDGVRFVRLGTRFWGHSMKAEKIVLK